MKKILTLLFALMAILPASADRYLTFGVNDTLRISPLYLEITQVVKLRAHFDGRLDKWDMTLELPQNVFWHGVSRGPDMLYVPYQNINGDSTYCSAQLFSDYKPSEQRDSISASIIVPGYWIPDNESTYQTYGTVKWEAGDYDWMCNLFFDYYNSISVTASIYIKEYLSSTADLRGGTIPNTYVRKRIFLYVGYMRGDVDGNEIINIADSSALTDYLLTHEGLDQYQLIAADVDCNGIIDISDFSALADLILELAAGSNGVEDPTI